MSDSPPKATVTITVDGRTIEANPGELLIAAAQRHGIYIPRFCHHPRMNPVGMCRMCLVEVDGPRGPALVVSCMTPVTEGMTVQTQSPGARKAQDGVLEFLLINHPLDCPVCDKGGECPLQDQTVAFGPGESRFVEEKRHYAKPIPLSDLVLLDRERCILCDRCTRFARDVAGDPLIHFTERGNQTQVLTFPDHPFASYFSGNTVQACPVGALTATPYRFKARPWDLDEVASTCTTCSVGCRIAVQASRNEVLRYVGVDVDAVNWGWLCDKGRFTFQAVNAPERLGRPLVRQGDQLVEATWSAALDAAAAAIRAALDRDGPSSVAVIGGARLTNESAYAWAKLAKSVIGTDSVDAQLGDGLPAEAVLGLPLATIDEACGAGVCLVLGPDPKEELPVLYIRLRDAVLNRRLRLVEVSHTATSLTPLAVASLRCRPGEEGALVRALLGQGSAATVGADEADVARAGALLSEHRDRLVVLLGRANVAASPQPLLEAVASLRTAYPSARFLPALRRGNVLGALDAGLSPGILPGRVSMQAGRAWFADNWGTAPEQPGLGTAGILAAAAEGRIGCLVLLGADPLADFPDRDLASRGLAGATKVVAVATALDASSRQADVVLAAAGFAEVDGTTTNLEGRVSRVGRKVTPVGTSRPDWMLAAELAWRLGGDLGIESTADAQAELARVSAVHAGVFTGADLAGDGALARRAPDAEGLPEPLVFEPPPAVADLVPLDGYSFRLVAARTLYDAGVTLRLSPALASLAPGARVRMNPTDHERLGLAGGPRVKLTSRRSSVVVAAVADAAVPRGTIWCAFNQPDVAVADLIDASAAVTDVRVETL